MKRDRINTTIDLIILILFTVSCVVICIQMYLGGFLSFLLQCLVVLAQIALLILFFIWILGSKKLFWLRRALMLLLSACMLAGTLALNEKRASITAEETITTYYRINLLAMNEDADFTDKKIGMLVSDRNHVNYFQDINEAFGIRGCEIKEYHSVYNLIKAIRQGEIEGILAGDRNRENIESFMNEKLVYINENVHDVNISHNVSHLADNEKFTVLLTYTGSDDDLAYVTKTDKCMILFVDPIDKKINYIELENNLYLPNVAYDAYPDALYNLSYNGIDNLLYSLESVFGFNMNYFVKINDQSILSMVDVMQGIYMDELCETAPCSLEKKLMSGKEALAHFKADGDFLSILKGVFDKRSELVTSKLMNFLNVFQRYTFTNMNMDTVRQTVAMVASENWNITKRELSDCETHNLPLISSDFRLSGEVSVMNESFLSDVYANYLNMGHLEIMKNFAFDLNLIHQNQIIPPYHEKTITSENMDWMMEEYFNLLPELLVNPVEVEKWQGSVNFDKPIFDPDDAIYPIK